MSTRRMTSMHRARWARYGLAFALLCGVGLDLVRPQDAEARVRRHRRYVRVWRPIQVPVVPDSLRDTTRTTLESIVDRAVAQAGGTMGVALVHLESGESLVRNGDQRFPMASTYKVPIAVTLLRRVDRGEITLGDTVLLRPSDLRTGSGRIAPRHPRGGHMTLHELFTAMLVESDNTASDFLMRVAGGPDAVTICMRDLGIRDLRVDRLEARMALDYYGTTDIPPDSIWNPSLLSQLMNSAPYSSRKASAAAFLDDPRDTSTPLAMTDLLARIWRGDALSPASTVLLIDTMQDCETGPGRIPALVPVGTRVAHKTGTWSSTGGITAALNDVGTLILPGNCGHVMIAAFVKGSRRNNGRIERCIAQIARAAWDHWSPTQAQLANEALQLAPPGGSTAPLPEREPGSP
jgi:beta-lactamase class A